MQLRTVWSHQLIPLSQSERERILCSFWGFWHSFYSDHKHSINNPGSLWSLFASFEVWATKNWLQTRNTRVLLFNLVSSSTHLLLLLTILSKSASSSYNKHQQSEVKTVENNVIDSRWFQTQVSTFYDWVWFDGGKPLYLWFIKPN